MTILPPISTLPEPAQVISLQDARLRFRPTAKCQHLRMSVDTELATVECDDCHEKLNPVAVLMRFATEESRWQRQAKELKELHAKLDERIRCKCQHCGQMTRIKP